MKNSTKWLGVLSLGALGFAGCSGGSSNNSSGNNANATLPATTLVAVTTGNRLLTFDARTPGNVNSRNITGITAGQQIVGVDFRFPAPSTVTGDGRTGLYALGQSGVTHQLYRLAVSGTTATATPVGSPFTFSPAPTAVGFDFNPAVDRIRLVEPVQNRNARINPNTGVVFDDPAIDGPIDGPLAYAASDNNVGQNPDIVGAAYTNVDADSTTGTVNFALDAANDTLVTQGRPASGTNTAISPNTGQLFTVARLSGLNIDLNTGFDIAGSGNLGLISSPSGATTRIFGVSLSSGTLSGGATLNTGGASVTGLAVVPTGFGTTIL